MLSWKSWAISTRDGEHDYVYVNGELLWEMPARHSGCKGVWKAGSTDFPYSRQGSPACYTIVRKPFKCSPMVSLTFTSEVNQDITDESWAFSDVKISEATYNDPDFPATTQPPTPAWGDGILYKEFGAIADGWSNEKIMDTGSAGRVHGPWGVETTSVVKNISIGPFDGADKIDCLVMWTSWSLFTRDNEQDAVEIDGIEVWKLAAHGPGCKGHWKAWAGDDFPFVTKSHPACYIKVSIPVSCGEVVSLRFKSGVDQKLGDEGWGFSDVTIATAGYVDPTASTTPEPTTPADMAGVGIIYTEVHVGAKTDDWSDPHITPIDETVGKVHGPYDKNMPEVSLTKEVPTDGENLCTVAWTSWAVHTRDGETDRLFVNGKEVWALSAMGRGCKGRWETYSSLTFPSSTRINPACFYKGHVVVPCTAANSSQIELKFTSEVDQDAADETWAFSNVVIAKGRIFPELIGAEGCDSENVGWRSHYYRFEQTRAVPSIPELISREPNIARTDRNLTFASSREHWKLWDGFEDHFASYHTTYFVAPVTDMYIFRLASDDGSLLFVDGNMIIDNDGIHGMQEKTGKVEMRAGVTYMLEVSFFEKLGGAGLTLHYSTPGLMEIEYIGCYKNEGENRVNGHTSSMLRDTCAKQALSAGHMYFGLEYPEGSNAAGHAECLTSNVPFLMDPAGDDVECGTDFDDVDHYLGGANRLAVYTVTTPILTTIPLQPVVGCTTTNELVWEVRGQNRYAFMGNPMTWEEAEAECQKHGSNLVTIETDATEMFVKHMLLSRMPDEDNSTSLWIGCNDRDETSSFVWSENGRSCNEDYDYQKWAPNEPSEADNEHCTVMQAGSLDADLSWSTQSCATERPFVCGGCAQPGWTSKYYNFEQGTKLPSLMELLRRKPSITRVDSILDYPNNNFFTASLNISFADHMASLHTTYFTPIATGRYEFMTKSDDGSKLLVDDKLVVNNDGTHNMRSATGKVDLIRGRTVKITVMFFETNGGAGLQVQHAGPIKDNGQTPQTSRVFTAGCASTNEPLFESYNGNKYAYFNEQKGYDDARDHCLALGADLVSIKSKTDEDFIRHMATVRDKSSSKRGFWTGCNDRFKEGDFLWGSDGSSCVAGRADYTSWEGGEPSNSGSKGEHCTSMRSSRNSWNDIPCERTLSYMCSTCERMGWSSKYFRVEDLKTTPLLEDLKTWTPELTRVEPELNFNLTQNSFKDLPESFKDNFASLHTTFFRPAETGNYSFQTDSDDGSMLYIDGVLVVDNDGVHAMKAVQSAVNLVKGTLYKIEVAFFERGGGKGVKVHWKVASMSEYIPLVGCPTTTSNWETIGSVKYGLFQDEKSLSDAADFCQAAGAQLVSIQSNETDAFVRHTVYERGGVKSGLWVGCNDIDSTGDNNCPFVPPPSEYTLLLSSDLSDTSLGDFSSGEQVGSLVSFKNKDYRVGMSGAQMAALGLSEIRIMTASGHDVILRGVNMAYNFDNPCTTCNCGGSKIGDDLYWHGGRGGCYGSSHFGFSQNGDVHFDSGCQPPSDQKQEKWGHFHRAEISSGVYTFGNVCLAEEEWVERFYIWGKFEWKLLLSSDLSSPSLGDFSSGEQIGELANAMIQDYRIGMTGAELQAAGLSTLMLQSSDGHMIKFSGITRSMAFDDVCTTCNCKGNMLGEIVQVLDANAINNNNAIQKSALYWHGGAATCHGSNHFGFTTDGDVHVTCEAETDHSWGHFHRSSANTGVYTFGDAGCINENEWTTRYYLWGLMDETPGPTCTSLKNTEKQCSTSGGCADGTTEAVFGDGVIGCDYAWSTPGIQNGGAACGVGWGLCQSSAEADELLLTKQKCGTAADKGKFYASAQSSNGNAVCTGEDTMGTNDIWGCGTESDEFKFSYTAACGNMDHMLGNAEVGAWKGLSEDTVREADYVYKEKGNGGVMCCRKPMCNMAPKLCETQMSFMCSTCAREGWYSKYFAFTQGNTVPDRKDLILMKANVTRIDRALDFKSTRYSDWGLGPRFLDHLASFHTTYLSIEHEDEYTFYLTSDDGAKLWVDGVLVVDNDGIHKMIEASGSMYLKAGSSHTVEVAFFEAEGGAGLIVEIESTVHTSNDYIGCYKNEDSNRVDGHMWHMSLEECAAAAIAGGKTYFGLEYPQGTQVEHAGLCLTSDDMFDMDAADSIFECMVEKNAGGNALGGANRLAVYKVNAQANIMRQKLTACASSAEAVWQTPPAEISDKKYAILSGRKQWADAQAHCAAIGGDLATVKSAEEEAFINHIAHVRGNHYSKLWLGCSNIGEEGIWTWASDGSSCGKDGYSNWFPGRPKNAGGSQNCALLSMSRNSSLNNEGWTYQWDDGPCGQELPYVCSTCAISGWHSKFMNKGRAENGQWQAVSRIPTLAEMYLEPPAFNVSRVDPVIYFRSTSNSSGEWKLDNGVDNFDEWFQSLHTTFFKAPSTGMYTFSLTSDDGSQLYVDGEMVVDNAGLHGMQERRGTIELFQGTTYRVEVTFFEYHGDAGLYVQFMAPGMTTFDWFAGCPYTKQIWNTIGEKSYGYFDKLVDFNTAQKSCTEMGAELVQIKDAQDAANLRHAIFSRREVPQNGIWVGCSDTGTNEKSKCPKGPNAIMPTCTDFYPAFSEKTSWLEAGDKDCSTPLGYVCSRPVCTEKGFSSRYYNFLQKNKLPTQKTLLGMVAVKTRVDKVLQFPPWPELSDPSHNMNDHFASWHTTFYYAEVSGEYVFTLVSDDGSKLLVDGIEILNNDGVRKDDIEVSVTGKAYLLKGQTYKVEVLYYEKRGKASLSLNFTGPGVPDEMPFVGCSISLSPWETFGNKSIGFFRDAKTWDDAQATCQQMGGNLVTIASKDDENAVSQLIYTRGGAPQGVWIGCHDTSTEGDFRWISDGSSCGGDGMSRNSFPGTAWSDNQPDNLNGEHCVDMRPSDDYFGWNDRNCGDRIGFVCEHGGPSPTTTATETMAASTETSSITTATTITESSITEVTSILTATSTTATSATVTTTTTYLPQKCHGKEEDAKCGNIFVRAHCENRDVRNACPVMCGLDCTSTATTVTITTTSKTVSTTTFSTTTESTTTTTYKPTECHGKVESKYCGDKYLKSDCDVVESGSNPPVLTEFSKLVRENCFVMCGLDCTSTSTTSSTTSTTYTNTTPNVTFIVSKATGKHSGINSVIIYVVVAVVVFLIVSFFVIRLFPKKDTDGLRNPMQHSYQNPLYDMRPNSTTSPSDDFPEGGGSNAGYMTLDMQAGEGMDVINESTARSVDVTVNEEREGTHYNADGVTGYMTLDPADVTRSTDNDAGYMDLDPAYDDEGVM